MTNSLVVRDSRQMLKISWRLSWCAVAGALLTSCPNRATDVGTHDTNRSRAYEVHGYVVVKVPQSSGNSGGRIQILLPDFEVFLKDITTGQESKPAKSNLFGMYVFPPQTPATYELRWHKQRGWDAGKLPAKIVIQDHVQYPGTIEPQPQNGLAVVSGLLKLADGGSPWFQDDFFGVARTATVTAVSSGGKAIGQPVRTNYQGEFAIAGLPADSAVDLQMTSEKATSKYSLAVAALRDLDHPAFVELTLENHRPRLLTVVAKLNGQPLMTPPAGSVLKVTADVKDPDGDALSFVWRTQSGAVVGTGAEVEWTLPKRAGVSELNLLVSDGKGGDVTGKVVVGAGATGLVFSGRVVNEKGSPVENAAVWVGDQKPVATNNAGVFRLETKEAGEYVLNIKAAGYALRSKFSERPLPYQTFRLVSAQVEQVNADANIELVDRRPDLASKKLKGSTIRVPAGALVDATGKRVTGQVGAEIATLDIGNDEMPGIMRTIKEGKTFGLISYGAVHVEFRDASGNICQLAPGAEAEAAIPLPHSMLAQAPPTMPLWSYDPKDGQWKPCGSAVLDQAEGIYRGKVNHLSTINTDQEFANPATILVHTDVSLPAELTLYAGDANVAGDPGTYTAYVGQGVLDGELSPNVGGANLVRLCQPGRHIQFNFADRNGASLDNWIIVESGNTYGIVGTPLPNNQVVAGAANTTIDVTIKLRTLWGGYPSSPFLQLYLKSDIGSAAKAAGYYDTIDPLHNRTNLADWFFQNGFDANGESTDPNYARTSYLNDNDLGSGRDMHFLKHSDGTLSAYVTNYSRGVAFDQRFAFADDALGKLNPGATVCMEYKPVENATGAFAGRPIVKFFVFADLDGLPGIERQGAANLDGFGAKFVPALCMNCHGFVHTYTPVNVAAPPLSEVDLGSNFRELDIATYRFSGARTTPNAAEQDSFRQQNLMIRDIAAAPPAGANPIARGPIHDLIDGWYPGSAGNQNNSYTPLAWQGSPQQGLYHDVVKTSCRTCHIAFDSSLVNNTGIDWNRYDQMVRDQSFINFVARGSQLSGTTSGREMPHALVTYRNFWLQQTPVHRPTTLWNYSDGTAWTAFGQPPP
ncbi:MAG: hypothetical protein QOH01_2620 [Verrucomicrobiota bacterium]|jgi:hypothetical protein